MAFWDALSGWFTTGTPTGAVLNGVSLSIENNDPALSRLMGVNEGKVAVTVDSAVSLPTVFRCVDILSDIFAYLPWNVLIREGDNRNIDFSHPCQYLLHDQAHPLYSAFDFKKVMMVWKLLHGNAYAVIQRNGANRPVAFKHYPNDKVTPYLHNDRIYYQISGISQPLQDYEVIHFKGFSMDGLVGKSVIRVAADAFRTGLQTTRFSNSFYENGTRLSGILTHDQKPSSEAKQNLKDSWSTQYTGAGNDFKTPTLTDGWKYQQIGIPPGDAQFIETKKFTRTDICALFGVPPHLVMDLERATFSNISDQDLQFLKYSLAPHIVSSEQEVNRKVFRESERSTHYSKINIKGLLRADLAQQTAHYHQMWMDGVYSQDEIRAMEDLNPLPQGAGGNRYYVQGAMMPTDRVDDMIDNKNTKMANPPAPANG